MGCVFDGSYAEYTSVPAGQVQKIKTHLPWETRGALPEMLQTAWGSLFKSLRLVKGERLLIRGIVGSQWSFRNFALMEVIPTSVCLTSDACEALDFMRMPLEQLLEELAGGSLLVQVGGT